MTRRSFEQANDSARRRLTDLVASLDGAALATDTGEGWTVATVLAHLAVVDRHISACWRRAGDRLTPTAWTDDAGWLFNDAVEALIKAVPGPVAMALATESATAADVVVAGLSDAAVAAVRGEGRAWLADTWEHRLDHIAQIERGLGRA